MNSQEIIDAYGTKPSGQLRLWDDADITLRSTPFQKVNPQFDREAIVHWYMNVHKPVGYTKDIKTPPDVLKSWYHALRSNFKFFTCDGYWPETEQSAPKLWARRNNSTQEILDEFMLWAPHVVANQKGKRFVSIIESTLSEYYLYKIELLADGQAALHRSSTIDKKGTIEEVVDFVREHHWYEEEKK